MYLVSEGIQLRKLKVMVEKIMVCNYLHPRLILMSEGMDFALEFFKAKVTALLTAMVCNSFLVLLIILS